MKKSKVWKVLYIDDSSAGTPLKDAVMTPGRMVDWDALDLIFQQNGIYNK